MQNLCLNLSVVDRDRNRNIRDINIKRFWNIPKQKYFAPSRIINLLIKSFFIPFVDMTLNFLESSSNSFLIDVTSIILLSKSLFFYEISNISFAC